jgi:hypothetical protein
MPTIDILPTKEAGDGFMGQCTLPSGERHYTFISGSLMRSRGMAYPARFWNDIRFIDGSPENGEIEVADREMSYGRFAQQYALQLDRVGLYERCEAVGLEPLSREDGTIVPSCIMYNCKDNAPGYLSEADLQGGVSPTDYAAVHTTKPAAAVPTAPTPVPTDVAPAPAEQPAAPAAPAIDMNALAQAIAAALAAQQS